MTLSADAVPTPQELTLALERLGWRRSGGVPRLLDAWIAVDESSSLVLPLDPSKGDFANLLGKALDVLRGHHGAAVEATLREVLRGTREIFDVSRFLRDTPNEGGIISWMDGKALLLAAEQSLVAAARSTRNPRKYHGNASSYISTNVLQSAYMGQTEIGSFVVTMLTQPDEHFAARKADEPKSGQEVVDSTGSISNRQVLLKLESALEGTRAALDDFKKIPKLDPFTELTTSGVSAELLRALATISQDVSRSAVSLDFSQPGAPVRRAAVEFSAGEAPILERASRRLMEDPDPIDVTIVGDVTMVQRAKLGGAGVARLRVRSGVDATSVRVRVDSDDYARIIEAHRDGVALEVTGRLERDGKYSWIYGPSELSFVEESDDEIDSTDSGDLLLGDELDEE